MHDEQYATSHFGQHVGSKLVSWQITQVRTFGEFSKRTVSCQCLFIKFFDTFVICTVFDSTMKDEGLLNIVPTELLPLVVLILVILLTIYYFTQCTRGREKPQKKKLKNVVTYIVDELNTQEAILKLDPLSSSTNQERVALDFGSFTIKAGAYQGTTKPTPSITVPSVIGTIKEENRRRLSYYENKSHDVTYVGQEALSERSILSFRYPITRYKDVGTHDYEAFTKKITKMCTLTCDQVDLILATPVDMLPQNNEKLVSLLFNDQNIQVDSVLLVSQPSCILASRGLLTGLVVDCGHECSIAVPVYESCSIDYALRKSEVGGNVLNQILHRMLLANQGKNWTTTTQFEIVREIKESLCYVAMDPKLENTSSESYRLPDKTMLYVEEERFQVPEFLFNPTFNNEIYHQLSHIKHDGIHKLAYESLQAVDHHFVKHMYQNIVLTGGTSMFPGFDKRFCKELNGLLVELQQEATVRGTIGKSRANDVWLGATVLGQLSSFEHKSITRAEYEEQGDVVIIRKCFA
jgi:actin